MQPQIRIDNADQRVTADIVQFSEELADLYTTVFKPCLDIVLFTGKLRNLEFFVATLLPQSGIETEG